MAIWGPTTRPVRSGEPAENVQRQYLWNAPNGSHPDFSNTYTYGDAILVSWNALNNSIYDLWLTGWDIDPDPVTLCMARAVNLANDGNLKVMTSNPPSAQLAKKTRYAFRFKPPTDQGGFVASDPDLSSPGFLLVTPSFSQKDVPSAIESGPASTTTSSSTASTATSSSTASTTASSTAFSTAPPSSTGLRAIPSREVATSVADSGEGSAPAMSHGAAAGLTIGLILVVALLAAMEVVYLMWRRKKRREAEDDGMEPLGRRRLKRVGTGSRGLFVMVDKAEMTLDDGLWMSPELPGDSTWGKRLVHELQGSRLGRGNGAGRALTINSSVVELEAGRG